MPSKVGDAVLFEKEWEIENSSNDSFWSMEEYKILDDHLDINLVD